MIYFIADTHFNHRNIIEYCNRPFKDTNEMNEYIIQKWNSVVKEEGKINVFGHIHDKPLDERFNKDNHICVSCDVVDYMPQMIEVGRK
ncbi:MAG: hypothetical protein U0N02_02720 [Clostridia bacterium]|nr:hypothetical protein [Clostridia bacterium]